jgi:cytosine/adenosine deaminase-related metal-dependent hydrolase
MRFKKALLALGVLSGLSVGIFQLPVPPLFSLTQPSLPFAEKSDLPSYVIENTHVVSMVPGEKRIRRKRTVVIHDGIIKAIFKSSEIESHDIPADAIRIPANGRYLLPGLIDSHVHLNYWTRIFPELGDSVYALEDLNTLHLANGITTVYNLATYYPKILKWGKKIASGKAVGPSIYCATRPFLDIVFPTAEEVEAAVLKYFEQGYHGIKIYGPMVFTNYQRLIETASGLGLDVFGHTPRSDVPLGYVLQNQKMICHTFYVYAQAFGYDFLEITEGQIQDLASWIRSAGTLVQPTAAVSAKDIRYMDPNWVTGMVQDDRMKYVSAGAKAIWLDAERWEYSEEEMEWGRQIWELERLLNRHMRQAGVVMPAGSDAPVRPFHVYGYALHDELREFVEDMGFSEYEAIEAATRINAEWMGILDRVGTVEEGKVADLILVRKNPLKNLRHLKKLDGVMVRGRWLTRSDLNQSLAELEIRMK